MTCMIIYFHLEFYYLQKLPWWGRRVEEGIYFSSAFVEWTDKLLHAFDCVCRDAHNYQSRYNFRPLFHVPLLLPDCYSITWSLVHVRLFYTLIHSFLCYSFIHSFIHSRIFQSLLSKELQPPTGFLYTIDIWNWITICLGGGMRAVPCLAGCVATSLATTHSTSAAPTPDLTFRNMSLEVKYPLKGQNHP